MDKNVFAPSLRAEDAKVTPLELFFDLIFVLALTQCTALITAEPTWSGILKATLVLAMLWWSWVGYAWLTSAIDPEFGWSRIAIFVAMAAFLIAALAVPGVFTDLGIWFAGAFALVRYTQVALFVLAGKQEPDFIKAIIPLAISTTFGVALITAAAFVSPQVKVWLWVAAVIFDVGGPLLMEPANWKIAAEHFAERHGLIVIIALGESIVAMGVGAAGGLTWAVVGSAALGLLACAMLWWAYFDVVALVAAEKLAETSDRRKQMALARDAYSYLHFPLVAGVVLLAVGLKKTLAHPDHHLSDLAAFIMFAGVGIYFLTLAVLRLRNIGRMNWGRFYFACFMFGIGVWADHWPALVALMVLTLCLVGFISFEANKYRKDRLQIRNTLR